MKYTIVTSLTTDHIQTQQHCGDCSDWRDIFEFLEIGYYHYYQEDLFKGDLWEVPISWSVMSILESSLASRGSLFFDKQFPAIGSRLLSKKIHDLRWLKTVSSTFQDKDFDGSLLPLLISWCYNHDIKKLPNHWWTRWYYFRHTVGYHSNIMTC